MSSHDKKETELDSSFNVSRWAIEHTGLTRYLMVAFMLLGLAAFFQLGQDEDPPFAFRLMVVRAYLPGASAAEMAEQVTDKLELALQEVPHVMRVISYTKPGESYSIIRLEESTNPKEVPELWYQTRKRISDMKHTLPQGVYGPYFNDDFGDVYGSIYALTADGFTAEEVRRYADQVRAKFLTVKDVEKVELFGVQAEKVYVEIPQFRLAQMGINISELVGQLNAQNGINSAGVYSGAEGVVQLRVSGAFESMDQIRAMPVRVLNPANGQARTISLGDVATIRRGFQNPPTSLVHHQGKEVIAIGISMAKGGDIIALGKRLQASAKAIHADLPVGIEMSQIQNQPAEVSRSVGDFMKVLLEAVLVVLAVSFVSLGLHTKPLRLDVWPGLVVAITIPLVLALTFLVMYVWGIGLHKISLGALIIALGLLVDDAIIAVEMMVHKLEEGYDKLSAAGAAYRLTAMPMLTGTLITAVGFLPIGMAKSATGEYTFAIFGVTAAALVISWFVSIYFVPFLGHALLKTKPKIGAAHDNTSLYDTPFYRRLKASVQWSVTHRWITIALTVLSLLLGVFGMSKVEQQFFPDSSRREILLETWFSEGTSVETTRQVTQRIEDRLLKHPDVEMVSSWIGTGVPRFYLPLDQIFPQTNVAQLIVIPHDLEARARLRKEINAIMVEGFPEVSARTRLLPNGPPVAYPVQFRIVGDDVEELKRWSAKAKELLGKDPDMLHINDNWHQSVKVIHLEIDQAKARALGVTSQSIAQASAVLNSGVPIGQYRESNRTIDIVLKSPESERETLGKLDNAYVPTASGKMVPILQVVKPHLSWEPGVLWREGRRFAVTVQGDVVDGVQGATVAMRLHPKMLELQSQMPLGYEVQIGGIVEESSSGQDSIAANLPVMLFIIFTLLMLQLQSFSRAFLVFLTGPLGISGVAAALLLFNQPLGFVALLGVIALMGMIMRNSVILIDQIEKDRSAGMPAFDAVVGAAVRRFRPIVLTAAAAVLAMIPLTRSLFWGPMAVAIMGGLVVATVLTILSLPAMYAAWFKVRPSALESQP